MLRFVGSDEDIETKTLPTVPSASCPIPHAEDWSVVDVAVGKGQQRFDRRVKKWSDP